jgi:hypothetical protein
LDKIRGALFGSDWSSPLVFFEEKKQEGWVRIEMLISLWVRIGI